MYPTLLTLGSLEFHAYAFFLALAFLIGTIGPVWQNERREKPFPITTIGGVWVFVGALLGAKVYWQVQYGDGEDWLRVFRVWEGGLVFYGGLFGGFLGGLLYVLVNRAPALPVGDLAMPFVPLAHAVARVGCFLNGCCWGSRSELPWAVHYPRAGYGVFQRQVEAEIIAANATHSAGVHPTQLYESLGLLIAFFIMRWAYKRPHRPGGVLVLYPMLYGVIRFTTEAFRGDSARHALDMTASQMVAIGFIVAGIAGWLLLRLLPTPPADETPATG